MSGKASDVSQGSPAMPAIVSIIIGSPGVHYVTGVKMKLRAHFPRFLKVK